MKSLILNALIILNVTAMIPASADIIANSITAGLYTAPITQPTTAAAAEVSIPAYAQNDDLLRRAFRANDSQINRMLLDQIALAGGVANLKNQLFRSNLQSRLNLISNSNRVILTAPTSVVATEANNPAYLQNEISTLEAQVQQLQALLNSTTANRNVVNPIGLTASNSAWTQPANSSLVNSLLGAAPVASVNARNVLPTVYPATSTYNNGATGLNLGVNTAFNSAYTPNYTYQTPTLGASYVSPFTSAYAGYTPNYAASTGYYGAAATYVPTTYSATMGLWSNSSAYRLNAPRYPVSYATSAALREVR